MSRSGCALSHERATRHDGSHVHRYARGQRLGEGLTAATDPRVARAAAGHVGLRYRARATASPQVEWSDAIAYVVGLIATDGCLISGRSQIAFVSLDRWLCEVLLRTLRRANRIRTTLTASGGTAYRVQFGDARLYRWLLSIGAHAPEELDPRRDRGAGQIRLVTRPRIARRRWLDTDVLVSGHRQGAWHL